MKMFKSVLFAALSVLVVLTIVTHLTPKMAVRASLFAEGYVKEACNSELKEKELDPLDDREQQLFTVTPAPFDKMTRSHLATYHVKVWGMFYWAEYHGEV